MHAEVQGNPEERTAANPASEKIAFSQICFIYNARAVRALFFQRHTAIRLSPRQIPGIPDRQSKTGYYCGMQVYLANPRGFCAGVDRAIEIVERALELFGAPIYVRHEVVHNRFVVDDLRTKGAIFVDELHQVPSGATVIFSAHGVSRAVREEAAQRGLRVFDATCPLVTKVHMEAARHRNNGTECILIGHAGDRKSTRLNSSHSQISYAAFCL